MNYPQTKDLAPPYLNHIKASFYHNTHSTNIKTEFPASDYLHHFNNKFFPLSPPSSDHSPFTCQDSNSDLEGGGSEEGSLSTGNKANNFHAQITPRTIKSSDFMGKIEERGDCNSQPSNEKPPILLESHLKKLADLPVLNGLNKYRETVNSTTKTSSLDPYFPQHKADLYPSIPIPPDSNNILGMVADKHFNINLSTHKYSALDGHSKEPLVKCTLANLPMEIALSPKSDMDTSFLNTDDISIFDMMDTAPIFDTDNQQSIIQNPMIDAKIPYNELNDTRPLNSSLLPIDEHIPTYFDKPSNVIHDYQNSFRKKNILTRQQLLERRIRNITLRINKLQANCLLKHSKKELDLFVKKQDFINQNIQYTPKTPPINHNIEELVSQINHYCDQDSDKTDSSSDDDSLFDDIYYNTSKRNSSKLQKTKINLKENPYIWKWEQTRASIARKWVWLQHQISYLDIKINQQKDIDFHLKAIKPTLKFNSDNSSYRWPQSPFHLHKSRSDEIDSNNDYVTQTCARCRPLSHYSKRKLYPNIALINNETLLGPLACNHYFNNNSLSKVKKEKSNQISPTKNYPWFHSNLTESRIPLVLLFNIATRTKTFVEDLNKNFKKNEILGNARNSTATTYPQAKSLSLQLKKKRPLSLKNTSRTNSSGGSNKKHFYHYDIDDMAITFNPSATTSIIIPHFDEILTPKWKIIEEFYPNMPCTQDGEDIQDATIQERHYKYQLKERSERNYFSKKKNNLPYHQSTSHNRQLKATNKATAISNSPQPASATVSQSPYSPHGSVSSVCKSEVDSNDSKNSIHSTNPISDKKATLDEKFVQDSPTPEFPNSKITNGPTNPTTVSSQQPKTQPSYGYGKRTFPLTDEEFKILLNECREGCLNDTLTFSF